ncbi:MAG: Crp/Fnr family transcriptional regulator [Hyphomicrobiaceae bacterium]
MEERGRNLEAVCFIENGVASIMATTGGGQRRYAEVASIGREGMTGLALVLGSNRSSYEAVMQVDGSGQCLTADELRFAMARSASLTAQLSRYAYAFSVQASNAALANALGTIEERLARWLLMAHDRADSDRLPVTHELISNLLGVRRAGITIALDHFVKQHLIEKSRGSVCVVDRDGLEKRSNGLYGVAEREYARLLPAGYWSGQNGIAPSASRVDGSDIAGQYG